MPQSQPGSGVLQPPCQGVDDPIQHHQGSLLEQAPSELDGSICGERQHQVRHFDQRGAPGVDVYKRQASGGRVARVRPPGCGGPSGPPPQGRLRCAGTAGEACREDVYKRQAGVLAILSALSLDVDLVDREVDAGGH